MSIKTVNPDYFQKSKLFLYPVLGIAKGKSVSLIETYISWNDKIKPTDCKLICLYYLRKDPEFINFEKVKLLNNKYFSDFYEIVEDKGVYIFDLNEYKDDWIYFLNGEYSKLSYKLKTQIINFQPRNTENYAYVNSFMYPEKYFGIYKNLLDVSIETLKHTGQLCDPPDFTKESLVADIKSLEIKQIIT